METLKSICLVLLMPVKINLLMENFRALQCSKICWCATHTNNEHDSPTTLDAVQLRTMLGDFLHFLTVLDFDHIWANTLEAEPSFPVARGRGGWQNNGQESNGSQDDWKQKLCGVAKLIKERDEALKRKGAKRAAKRRRMHGDEDVGRSQQEMVRVEDEDEFDPRDDANVDEDCVNEGEASMQDLLTVIHNAGLADALPQVMILLEIAVVNPLTSVHCERVFS
eukprot:gene13225-14582_t